jgi:hypothetical protein
LKYSRRGFEKKKISSDNWHYSWSRGHYSLFFALF